MTQEQLTAIRARRAREYKYDDNGWWLDMPQRCYVASIDVGELLDEVERLRAVILRISAKQEPNA